MIIEACVETIDEALIAQENGANRIELCADLVEGGTTPSFGLISSAITYMNIPIMVMIRPRGGNFIYNEKEIEIMKKDIDLCKQLEVDGIVLGLLDQDRCIDLDKTRILCQYAFPLQVTFHKAIDDTKDLVSEFIRLKESAIVNRVLTSGGARSAFEGTDQLKHMITLAGNDITIIVAGGVTKDNLNMISQSIPCSEYHGRKIVGDLNNPIY
ncbi:copper homeostasis protein CutC [Bacteroidota bacterium]